MKKTLLLLVATLIIGLSFAFTGCSKMTVDGQLGDYFNEYENFTYQMVEKNSKGEELSKGTLTISIERFEADKNYVLDKNSTFSLAKGYRLTTNLTVNKKNNKTDTITSETYFEITSSSGFMAPRYSTKKQNIDGKEISTKINYNGTSCSYTLTKDGFSKTGNLTSKGKVFDSNEIYTMARSSKVMGTSNSTSSSFFSKLIPGNSSSAVSFSLSFNCPIPIEDEMATLTAAYIGDENLTKPKNMENDPMNLYDSSNGKSKDKKRPCSVVRLSRSTKIAGANIAMWYSTSKIEINGSKFEKVLMKIVEPRQGGDGQVTYQLISASNVKKVVS